MTAVTLSGTLRVSGEGTPLATVELRNASGDVVDQVQANEQGSYVFYVTPGRWTLAAWDPHGHRATREVTLSEDRQEVVDLDLS